MNQSQFLFDIVALGSGGFFLYTWGLLRSRGKLFENTMLIPKGKEIRDCADHSAYIRYISPRLLAIGVCTFVYGGCNLLNDLFHVMSDFWENTVLVGTIVAVVWYCICLRTAYLRYWTYKRSS